MKGMTVLKTLIASALFATVAAGSSAMALPAAPASSQAAAPASLIEPVQMRHRGPVRHPHVVRHRHRYAPGSRLRAAPRGWHRYGARPGNWRTRGCVVVGAIWFCP